METNTKGRKEEKREVRTECGHSSDCKRMFKQKTTKTARGNKFSHFPEALRRTLTKVRHAKGITGVMI